LEYERRDERIGVRDERVNFLKHSLFKRYKVNDIVPHKRNPKLTSKNPGNGNGKRLRNTNKNSMEKTLRPYLNSMEVFKIGADFFFIRKSVSEVDGVLAARVHEFFSIEVFRFK